MYTLPAYRPLFQIFLQILRVAPRDEVKGQLNASLFVLYRKDPLLIVVPILSVVPKKPEQGVADVHVAAERVFPLVAHVAHGDELVPLGIGRSFAASAATPEAFVNEKDQVLVDVPHDGVAEEEDALILAGVLRGQVLQDMARISLKKDVAHDDSCKDFWSIRNSDTKSHRL
jgi:hypothetical protein